MHIDATPAEAQTILKAMRAVAAAGAAITAADRASVVAAARYIFQIELSPDLAGLAPPRPEELKALAARPDLATEAVCFATVMAFVDGTLDDAKLSAVASLAATLGVKADFVDDIAEVAQGHLRSATAHMIRANLESLTGKPWDTDDAMPWLMPYKTKPDPALAARFHTLLDLPKETFGHAFAAFYRANKYAFPGEEEALNFAFAAPHDSSHLLAGYDTSPRGEVLASTFTAAMHRSEAMSGHVLPVIFSWHLGIPLNELAGSAKGALDPAGILARLGPRRAHEGRPVRSRLGLLGGDGAAGRCRPGTHRSHRLIDSQLRSSFRTQHRAVFVACACRGCNIFAGFRRCGASQCGKSTSIANAINRALNIALEARRSACLYNVMSTILIEVRRAKPSDATAIAATHDEAWRGAYQGIIPGPELDKLINRRGPQWWDSAVRKGSRIAVLAFGDSLAGYANYGRNRARSLYYDGEIYELYLRPEFQGLGFGRKLFSAARRDLMQSGLQSMVVWALSDNEPATGFYRALGGKAVARSSEKFGNRVLDKVAFAWNG